MEYTKYAAVGHFKGHRTLDGKKYPVVIVGRKEYMLDVQEMTVWSSLAWRILSRSQIAETYLKLTRGLSFTSRRTLDDCIDRLVTRGLRSSFLPVYRAGIGKPVSAPRRVPEALALGWCALL